MSRNPWRSRWPKTSTADAASATSLSERMARGLPERACEALARRTGFQRRKPRKISPFLLLRSLGALAFCARRSLETLALAIGALGGEPVSKQAVAKRLGAACVAFLREALFAAIASTAKFGRLRDGGVFRTFGRVLIQDSTSLSLSPRLAAAFPGSRNQSGKTQAGAKIQAIYDLLAEGFVRFAVTAFTRNDQAASKDMLRVARKGDLVLRDLGYFVLKDFAELHRRGVFYLSRLRGATVLLDARGRPFDLLRALRREGRLDVALRLGKAAKLSVRLVAAPLPVAVANERRRKARLNRDKRCRPDKARLALLGWEIFVTNVPATVWSSEEVCCVYGLRWRIEIIFKAWKSNLRFADLPAGSAHQVQAWLYARLLCVTVLQTFYGQLEQRLERRHGRALSLLRLTALLGESPDLIAPLTRTDEGLVLLERLLAKHCCYEKRRDRLNYAEVIRCLG